MSDYKNTILSQQAKYYDTYLKIKDNPRYRKSWGYIVSHPEFGKKVLDIGCADGEFSKYLIDRGYSCFGLESGDIPAKQARANGLVVKKWSFLDRFPYPANYFDIVFGGEVIEHTVDDSGFLKEIYRVTKPNGLLILTTPNLVSLGNRFLMLLGKIPRFVYADFHYRIFTPEILKIKLIQSGFKIERINSSYILISTFFNKFVGVIGEWLGSLFPNFGEHLIFFAKKTRANS